MRCKVTKTIRLGNLVLIALRADKAFQAQVSVKCVHAG